MTKSGFLRKSMTGARPAAPLQIGKAAKSVPSSAAKHVAQSAQVTQKTADLEDLGSADINLT